MMRGLKRPSERPWGGTSSVLGLRAVRLQLSLIEPSHQLLLNPKRSWISSTLQHSLVITAFFIRLIIKISAGGECG